MNYRHHFHAGNFADIMKHTVLVVVLEALNRKPAPWCYFETHAGAGVYDLKGEAAAKTGEAATGISRLWAARDQAPAPVAKLCTVVAKLNQECACGVFPRRYPGSPVIAAALARAQDRLVLAELYPQEERVLRARFHADHRIALHLRDGYEMLPGLVPPPERRGLVLMDPPFEKPDEFALLVTALRNAHTRWPAGIYALWYPLKDAPAIARFERGLIQSGIRRILLAEFRIAPPGIPGFYGCGMAIVNPPWQSDQGIGAALNFLKEVLASEAGSSQVHWLVKE